MTRTCSLSLLSLLITELAFLISNDFADVICNNSDNDTRMLAPISRVPIAKQELIRKELINLRWMRRNKRHRRTSRHSISSAIVETVNCEHIELIDCADYGDKGMRCMLTATGMPCCICNGRLRVRRKRRWHSRINRYQQRMKRRRWVE